MIWSRLKHVCKGWSGNHTWYNKGDLQGVSSHHLFSFKAKAAYGHHVCFYKYLMYSNLSLLAFCRHITHIYIMWTSKLSLWNCVFTPRIQTVSDHPDILLQLCMCVCGCVCVFGYKPDRDPSQRRKNCECSANLKGKVREQLVWPRREPEVNAIPFSGHTAS